MAIITRWFMPPESWCGNAFIRLDAAGSPTCSSNSITRPLTARRGTALCARSDSAICQPTG